MTRHDPDGGRSDGQSRPIRERLQLREGGPSGLSSRLRRLGERAAHAASNLRSRIAGSSSSLTVDGVHYRHVGGHSVASVLGSTSVALTAEYDVTFPAGELLTIRATRERLFYDLMAWENDNPLAWTIQQVCAAVLPGQRALLLGAGTGVLAAAVSEAVGPSGAVTSLECDAASVEYARLRYPRGGVAHEHDPAMTFDGEPDRSADALIITQLAPGRITADALRLLAPGGVLLALGHHAPRAAQAIAEAPIPAEDAHRHGSESGPDFGPELPVGSDFGAGEDRAEPVTDRPTASEEDAPAARSVWRTPFDDRRVLIARRPVPA